ncbi:flagellar hook capping FlgD N-terminal domain-containing protein [Massilia yuzhufengensis]|uniref:Basal-body rod modification protein FlgD n=1 Tax=Massilia yuzhufengensis TaxID=1164594 RepID=A0A1I1G1I1_9BURK|nr:flagellar hook capping FlgD N-terminal domain-containing protein [Massilia yuzhufengensis]SFC05474.1 flagellar basal-body rod modification protein FlgD [Massilia yuzhufengensis]
MVTTTNSFGFTANNTPATDRVATSTATSENKDMFTKLLVAQIRNQDPLAPSDPSQFVNQLSQLSQTEALQQLAQTQSASASMLQSLQVLAMGGQVGTEVSVAASRVRLGEDSISGSVQLGGASSATSLVLTGVDGQQHRISLPTHGAGALPFTIDPVALGLAPGNYSISAEASDGTKPAVEVSGRLDSVRMSASGGIVLQVAGIGEVDPSSVTGFNGKGKRLAATDN